MKQELIDQIYAAAPELYHNEPPKDNTLSPRGTAHRYGKAYIGVGDGWFKLILDLSVALEALGQDIMVTQVKEKFGGLRFYVSSATPEAYSLIDAAEALSEQTCETCGEPGKPMKVSGWIAVLCDAHAKEL